jgi:hypothetical protein
MQFNDKILFCIVVHDPEIINRFEQDGKYNHLKHYNYLLVGQHTDDFTTDKIIQCNKLPNNIEINKNYLAYTAWYAVAHNNIISPNYEYIFFLEYDTNFIDKNAVDTMIQNIFKDNKNVYGTDAFETTSCFLDNSIFTSLVVQYLLQNNITGLPAKGKHWMATNNMAFKRDFIKEFFNDDFTKNFFTFLNNDKMSGHNLERFLSVYCFYKRKAFGFINPHCLKHQALDSHNTQGRNYTYEEFKAINKISDKK